MHVLRARRTLFVCVLALASAHAHAQGCSQCRDNVSQSSPATQQAYRHSIYLLGGAALFFCGVTVIVARAFGAER
jgi:hypothetical protein